MAYTVRKLLESEQFPKMKLLCGEKGLDLEVKGIRIIEIEDMERYLTGGEILITSFQVYLSCSDREVEQHFEDLVKSDISGFIVKKRKEYDPTGRRLSLLEKHCKKYEIPLVEISEDSYYWGIIRYVMIQVFDKDTARLKYFKITHDSFNTFILKNNGSSNTASDIIKFLSIMIENPVVLYYGDLNCMVSTNSDNSKLILSDEIQPYKPNIITKFQYMKQMKGSCVQYVVKFAILSEVEIYITITEENRELTELDYMAIENAIINLQYGFLSEFAQNEVKKTYQRDLIHNILNGLLSSKEMTEAAAQLGMKESDTYRVVDFHTITKNVQRKYTKEQLHEVGVIEGELMHLLPDALIYRNMDQIVMIQQVDSNQTELEYQKEMEEIEEVIQRSILYRKKDTDFQIGIGKSVEGYQRLKESYYEASQAIKYIEIIRQVTGDKNKSVVHYSNLGFFQIFGEIDDVTELERYIPETLKKLYLYDDEHKGELITTLQMYLRNNQSIKKTAGAMFVHYRTISYRLEKIKQISGINFDNANEVLAVSNGLIIYKMLKEIE
ncbi:PucR family transcriptional regulator [Hominisplanchenecus sp.]